MWILSGMFERPGVIAGRANPCLQWLRRLRCDHAWHRTRYAKEHVGPFEGPRLSINDPALKSGAYRCLEPRPRMRWVDGSPAGHVARSRVSAGPAYPQPMLRQEGLMRTMALIDHSPGRTRARHMVWIDQEDRHPGQPRPICDPRPQVCEGPCGGNAVALVKP